MDRICRTLIAGLLMVGLAATPAMAFREFTPELGYVITSESKYGSGLIYGVIVMEGTGRFGLGLSLMRFENSSSYQRPVKIDGDVTVFKYKENFSDSYIGILGTWMHGKSPKVHFIAAIGPQIHFLSATRQRVVQGFTDKARESRLGIGALVRYERRIEMFGSTSFVVAASYSWMESGIELWDVYTPPAQGLTSAALTVGLAFPF
jgi:hypothetical protein